MVGDTFENGKGKCFKVFDGGGTDVNQTFEPEMSEQVDLDLVSQKYPRRRDKFSFKKFSIVFEKIACKRDWKTEKGTRKFIHFRGCFKEALLSTIHESIFMGLGPILDVGTLMKLLNVIYSSLLRDKNRIDCAKLLSTSLFHGKCEIPSIAKEQIDSPLVKLWFKANEIVEM